MAEDDAALEAYFAALAERAGTPALGAEEAAAVLDLTRVVAHTSERRFAPLVAYAVGLTAGRSPDPPARVARVREVLAVVRELGREAGADDGG
ncbi:MAG TPA: DUF6457 domain-containing protein [Egibacteraceae bacterium]